MEWATILGKFGDYGAFALLVGVLLWFFISKVFPSIQKRADEARADDRILLREVSSHIAVSNINAQSAAERNDLIVSSLRDLKGAFDISNVRDEERRKRDDDLNRINNHRWEQIAQQLQKLGDARQHEQIQQSAERLKKKKLTAVAI